MVTNIKQKVASATVYAMTVILINQLQAYDFSICCSFCPLLHLLRFVKCEGASGSPVDWTVSDVVSYITAAGFPEQAAAFRTQVSLWCHVATSRWHHRQK